jgi:hypothetical protein
MVIKIMQIENKNNWCQKTDITLNFNISLFTEEIFSSLK